MSGRGWLLACCLLVHQAASAHSLGLGFWVDASLVRTETQRQAMTRKLAAQVQELNARFAASQVDLQAEVVVVREVNITQPDAMQILQAMYEARDAFANLPTVADHHGADFNLAIVQQLTLRGQANCGRAYAVNQTLAQIASPSRAVAVLNSACGTQTLAHELGHLMGLNHGRLADACMPGQGHAKALTPYALGYGQGNCDQQPQVGEFATIMLGGYLREIAGSARHIVPLFSNPRIRDVRCGQQGICGDAEFADAARTLNEHAHIYAEHAEPDVSVLNYADPALSRCLDERYRFFETSELHDLDCSHAGIKDLAGLKQLRYLKRINLSGNPLTDIGELLALPAGQIERIDLSDTHLAAETLASLRQRFGQILIGP